MKTKKEEHNIEHPAINECLVYDLETSSLDPKNGEIRFFGAYSYKHKKYYIIDETESQAFAQLLEEHKVIIGFNNKEFDNAFLKEKGFDIEYKIVFDCLKVLYDHERKKENRSIIIELPNGQTLYEATENYKLRTVCKALNIPTEKGEIDYHIFQKPVNSLSSQERKEIELYLYKDVKATKELFEFYVKYFEPFTHYVNDENIRKFNYIRSSTASYSYSALCNLTNLPEEYADDENRNKEDKFKGATVLEIAKTDAKNVVCFDFSSLYPSLIIQLGLMSRIPGEPKQDFWGLSGLYNSEQSKVEKVLYEILKKRIEYKKAKDPRQLALKIMLNSFYGLSSNPIFKTFYNETSGPDTCTAGRKCLDYSMKIFNESGFNVLYGDTDSLFVEIPDGKTSQEAVQLAEQIVKELKSKMPFPIETWKLAVDKELKILHFEGKKNYIAITNKDKLIIKGLPIIKSDSSALSKKILEIIKPQLIEKTTLTLPKEYIESLVENELRNDLKIIAQNYKVKNPENYNSKTCIHAQIATAYGEGEHQLVPNTKIGKVGKGRKYCTLDEAKDLVLSDLSLDKFWSEIRPFITGQPEAKDI